MEKVWCGLDCDNKQVPGPSVHCCRGKGKIRVARVNPVCALQGSVVYDSLWDRFFKSLGQFQYGDTILQNVEERKRRDEGK